MSMGRYCQERATQVLDDFALAGTFLLNCEETFRGWPGSCLTLTNRSMSRHSLLCAGQVQPSQPPQSRNGQKERALRNCTELNDLSLFPTDHAWGRASYPTEVSGKVALVRESG